MSEKPQAQRVEVNEGIDAHGGMGEAPAEPQIPQEVLAEANRQVEMGAKFFGKPLKDCTREELYAAVIMGWYDAQDARYQLEKLGVQP